MTARRWEIYARGETKNKVKTPPALRAAPSGGGLKRSEAIPLPPFGQIPPDGPKVKTIRSGAMLRRLPLL